MRSTAMRWRRWSSDLFHGAGARECASVPAGGRQREDPSERVFWLVCGRRRDSRRCQSDVRGSGATRGSVRAAGERCLGASVTLVRLAHRRIARAGRPGRALVRIEEGMSVRDAMQERSGAPNQGRERVHSERAR